jgi:hypothetical protein
MRSTVRPAWPAQSVIGKGFSLNWRHASITLRRTFTGANCRDARLLPALYQQQRIQWFVLLISRQSAVKIHGHRPLSAVLPVSAGILTENYLFGANLSF